MIERSLGEKMFLLGVSMLIAVVLTFGISRNFIPTQGTPKNVFLLSFYIIPIILASNYYALAGGICFAAISTVLTVALARSAGILVGDTQLLAQIILYFIVGGFTGYMQRENMRIQKALHTASITDELTGLYNYQYFRSRLDEEVRRARRYEHPLSLMMCDIDKFKRYNDTLGHPAGNVVINRIAVLIKESIRESDIPFRYGGDEFAVLFPETGAAARMVVDRLVAAVDAATDFESIGPDIKPSLTAGIACSDPGSHLSASQLVSMADRTLYEAKRSGEQVLMVKAESDRVS